MGDLCVGVGAGSRVGAADIVAAVVEVCGDESVRVLATLDRKTELPPFRDAAEVLGTALVGFPADELAAVAVPNPAVAVDDAVGTPSVAEAAALLASDGGPLIVTKHVTNGVTLAVARSVS
ncbi:cobalamin biosynthesis protein [Rhodococcus hoagii]|uniref:Cobalamin biosynthesis protein n=1 Tax=Rhodococcus hoagii TaxID=43767 RepID=A0AAE2W254_RHOHA|nr:cobalamin biosynthesis protein [Prescottella equi]MBM4493341.1 cobalamin biosynthesis protein [Prescottella equi]MBM4511298.1 cobalamin biosynthesis protein [Prescottella equi]MBM4540251.1 cobalamin biosynthesis protein [Prescottella equi]MBM4695358.1 cobalamin biosynthesis protein [Prescottella equi]MBM4712658.1 cobalamin biosynthesis protein [Prescottella equi]